MIVSEYLDVRDELQDHGYKGIVARYMPDSNVQLGIPVKHHTLWFLTVEDVKSYLKNQKGDN